MICVGLVALMELTSSHCEAAAFLPQKHLEYQAHVLARQPIEIHQVLRGGTPPVGLRMLPHLRVLWAGARQGTRALQGADNNLEVACQLLLAQAARAEAVAAAEVAVADAVRAGGGEGGGGGAAQAAAAHAVAASDALHEGAGAGDRDGMAGSVSSSEYTTDSDGDRGTLCLWGGVGWAGGALPLLFLLPIRSVQTQPAMPPSSWKTVAEASVQAWSVSHRPVQRVAGQDQ